MSDFDPDAYTAAPGPGHPDGIADTYRELLDANRGIASHLGIPGADGAGNAERFELARNLKSEETRRDEAAYATADWTREPNLKKIFGLDLLLAAEGSVERALEDPRFAETLERDLGFGGTFEIINDEDGVHEEYVPSTGASPETAERIQRELELINDVAAHGWEQPTPPTNAVEHEDPQAIAEKSRSQAALDIDHDAHAQDVAPRAETDQDQDLTPEEPRVVIDVDHHVQQSAALAARAGLLLGLPQRRARTVADGTGSLVDSPTPTSPLLQRVTQLTTDAAAIAANDMDDRPLMNPTRGPGLYR